MWWITEGEGDRQQQHGTEDIELPRPSPMKPHLYPPVNSSIQNQHPRSSRDFHGASSGGGSGVDVRDSDDAFLARLGLGNTSRDGDRERRPLTGKGSQEFLLPKYSRDFGRGVESESEHHNHPSIDDMISEDVQFSNSIERLLNAYPKHPTSAGASFDRDMHRHRAGGRGEGAGYRLRPEPPSSSLDLQEGGTMKGLLLSLKLDGRSSMPDKATDGARDQKEMSENLQAIIDSLHCLDETTGEGGGRKGPGTMAENIQQVGANLHADMSSFAALYGEKYASEERAAEERQLRDEQMRLEGRREQLKDLQRDHCRTLDVNRSEEDQLQAQAQSEEDASHRRNQNAAGSEETKSANPSHMLSHISTAAASSAATALAESRLRAAWVGTESRPVWSPQLGKYVLPPGPTSAEEQRRRDQIAQEEESLKVFPPSYQPLFSSSSPPPAHAITPSVSSGYSSGLSHGSITRAARTAIETCLNATEQTLLIRLPEEEGKEAVEKATVLDEVFVNSQVKSLPVPGSEGWEPNNEVQQEGAEETKKAECTVETTAITTTSTIVPTSAVTTTLTATADVFSTISTMDKLDKLDALLGHDDEASLRFLAAYREQKSIALVDSSPQKIAAVKFRSLEEINDALSSKPSLPPGPVYQHNVFEQPHTADAPANLNGHSHPQRHQVLASGGRHTERLSPRGSSSTPRGAVPHFLLRKAYPDNQDHDRNYHHSSPHSPTYSPPHHHQPERMQHEFGGARATAPRYDDDNNGRIINNTAHDFPTQNNCNSNPVDDDTPGGCSNFHERTIFLEQMKRLRLNMTQ